MNKKLTILATIIPMLVLSSCGKTELHFVDITKEEFVSKVQECLQKGKNEPKKVWGTYFAEILLNDQKEPKTINFNINLEEEITYEEETVVVLLHAYEVLQGSVIITQV